MGFGGIHSLHIHIGKWIVLQIETVMWLVGLHPFHTFNPESCLQFSQLLTTHSHEDNISVICIGSERSKLLWNLCRALHICGSLVPIHIISLSLWGIMSQVTLFWHWAALGRVGVNKVNVFLLSSIHLILDFFFFNSTKSAFFRDSHPVTRRGFIWFIGYFSVCSQDLHTCYIAHRWVRSSLVYWYTVLVTEQKQTNKHLAIAKSSGVLSYFWI